MRRAIRALAAAAVAFQATACITVGGGPSDAPPDRFHVLDLGAGPTPSAPAQARAPVGPGLRINVKPFRAAGRLSKSVLRREGTSRVAPVTGEYWADEPAAAVAEVVSESLERHVPQATVVDFYSPVRADVWLDGVVGEFCVEMPAQGPARASVRLRLTWTGATPLASDTLIATETVAASEAIPGPGLEGLGAAMARAVDRAIQSSIPADVRARASGAAR